MVLKLVCFLFFQTIGQLIAFGASQLLLLGLVLIVWNDKELPEIQVCIENLL